MDRDGAGMDGGDHPALHGLGYLQPVAPFDGQQPARRDPRQQVHPRQISGVAAGRPEPDVVGAADLDDRTGLEDHEVVGEQERLGGGRG